MRKLLGLLLLSLSSAAVSSASTVGLVPPVTIHVGDTFDVAVQVTSDGMQGYQFDLLFPSFLQANSVTGTGFFAPSLALTFSTIDNGVGFIYILGLLDSDGTTCGTDFFCSTDTLALINFTALSAGSGDLLIDTSEAATDAALIVTDGSTFATETGPTFQSASITVVDVESGTPEPGTWILIALPVAIAMHLRRRKLAED